MDVQEERPGSEPPADGLELGSLRWEGPVLPAAPHLPPRWPSPLPPWAPRRLEVPRPGSCPRLWYFESWPCKGIPQTWFCASWAWPRRFGERDPSCIALIWREAEQPDGYPYGSPFHRKPNPQEETPHPRGPRRHHVRTRACPRYLRYNLEVREGVYIPASLDGRPLVQVPRLQ